MALKTKRWDSTEHLQSEEDIAAYLDAVLEEDDPALVTHALGVIASAKGMSQIAKEAGCGAEKLEQALVDRAAELTQQFAVIRPCFVTRYHLAPA